MRLPGRTRPAVASAPPGHIPAGPHARREADTGLAARNRPDGTVVGIDKGAVNATVRIDMGGAVLTAMITNASVEDLAPGVGRMARAVIGASDVIPGTD